MQDVLQAAPALLIALEPDDDSDKHDLLRLRAWVWLGPDRAERISRHLTGSYSIDELRIRLREVYREAQRYQGQGFRSNDG